MWFRTRLGVLGAAALIVSAPVLALAEGNNAQQQQQSFEELRNTVVNLLQALVEKGLITREQAEQMVKQAQTKASADAAAQAAKNAETEKAEENAVRVPYVPQIVKDEISKQVEAEVKPAVVADVVKEAKAEKWGVPAALPAWISDVRVFGDVTIRGQADMFASDNSVDEILNFQTVNTAGGFGKTAFPFLNTTGNNDRLRVRARFGVEADPSPNWTAAIRLATGSLTDPGSESQNAGTYGERWGVSIDQAYLRFDSSAPGHLSAMTAEGGRIINPWFSPTELIYARDLLFEGVAGTWRLGFGSSNDSDQSLAYLTAGAFPMLDVPIAPAENKLMVGGQIGTNLRWADGRQHLRFGAAYYEFQNVTGQKNLPDSTLLNWTAPAFIRNGNSVFDISNSTTDPTVNLYGLASHFRLADLAATYELSIGSHVFIVNGEAVRNVAYSKAQILAFSPYSPQPPPTRPENIGYVGEIGFGDPSVNALWDWRARVGYRYVRADAVIDAWTDADFHEGGTNAEGYYIWGELGLAQNVWARLRYMSGNEIDGPRYGLDIVQFDLNTRF